LQRQVPGLVDDAHAAPTQHVEDLIPRHGRPPVRRGCGPRVREGGQRAGRGGGLFRTGWYGGVPRRGDRRERFPVAVRPTVTRWVIHGRCLCGTTTADVLPLR